MRRIMLLIAFCATGVLMLSSVASAQQSPLCSELTGGAEQEGQEAQAILAQAPSDPYATPRNFDADGDGIICEYTEVSGKLYFEDGSVISAAAAPLQDIYPKVYEDGTVATSFDTGTDCRSFTIIDEKGYSQGTQEEIQSVLEQCRSLGYLPVGTQSTSSSGGNDVAELPDTGGPSGVALLAGALLLGSGLVIRRLVR